MSIIYEPKGRASMKPLPLTAEMALAALRGPKTRTMRPMNYQMPWAHHVEPLDPAKWGKEFPGALPGNSTWLFQPKAGPLVNTWFNVFASPWKPGDVLWLREPGRVVTLNLAAPEKWDVDIRYLADGEVFEVRLPERFFMLPKYIPNEPPAWAVKKQGIPNGIFREAARAFFEVTAAWPMRVQDISEAEARAEGVGLEWYSKGINGHYESYRDAFEDAWNSIYAAKGQGWDANPWVWVVEFKRVEVPIC